MEAETFDRLTRALTPGRTRRGLLRLLAQLPLAAGLAVLFGQGPDAGAQKDPKRGSSHRHHRRRARNRHDPGQDKDQRNDKNHHKGKDKGKGKHKQDTRADPRPPACQPESKAQTCASKCATISNNCGTPVDCGACACEPACPICQTCDGSTGQCVASDVGDSCDTCRTCDAAGQCVVVADNTPCDDDDACTQTDTCQGGACVGRNPVVCTATDQCHAVGDCNSATGLCSNPNKDNGTPCDDGDACTLTDTCQNGECVGGNPAVCTTPPGPCYRANGTCQPDGACAYDVKPRGAACNDQDDCTQTDACDGAGNCAGNNPVICLASDQCHVAGICNPATGTCSNPEKDDGTSCDDRDACTQIDTCQNGECVGTNPVVCTALDQCHDVGTCNPSTGTCSNPNKTDGASCNDGNACTENDTCQNGICTAGTPKPYGTPCGTRGGCQNGQCVTCGGTCEPFDGNFCQTGCVCSSVVTGTCIQAPAPGTCGGGCAPARAMDCPDGCVCTDLLNGTCKASSGICGGGACSPNQGFNCPEGCVCSDPDKGTCVAAP